MKTELTKFCPRCKTEKSMDDFYNNKAQYDGKQSHCKECTRLYQKEYYSRPGTREAMIENAKRWRLENPDRVREHHKNKLYLVLGLLLRIIRSCTRLRRVVVLFVAKRWNAYL